MFTALSIALGATSFLVVFLAAWMIDLRARSLRHDAELRDLQGMLGSGDRPRLREERIEAGPSDSAPPSAPRRMIPPDIPTLLVRSLTGGDRGPRDASPGAAIIRGAQAELALVAEMLLRIDPNRREAWPEPPAIGNVLTALSDRLLAGLELLSHEADEPPPSSDPGGPLTH